MAIRLSICVPTYNRAKYLQGCLKSIKTAAHDYLDSIEVVVSDNASTDDTAAIVATAQVEQTYIRYCRNAQNVGAERNCYLVAALGRGEYIWLFGDDDEIEPDAIAVVLGNIQRGHEVLICNYSQWDKNMEVRRKESAFSQTGDRTYSSANALLRDFHLHCGYISSVVIKKSRFFAAPYEEYGPFLDYGFPHLYSVYVGVAMDQCRAAFISAPLVRNRGDNSGGYDWYKYFVAGSCLVFEALRRKGYSAGATRYARGRVLMTFLLPNIFLTKLSGGRTSARQVRLFVQYYKCDWRLWVLFLPALLIPRSVMRGLKSAVRGWRSVTSGLQSAGTPP